MAIDRAPTNVRIWSDGGGPKHKQSFLSSLVAIATLTLVRRAQVGVGWGMSLTAAGCHVDAKKLSRKYSGGAGVDVKWTDSCQLATGPPSCSPPPWCPQYTGWMHVLLVLAVLSYWYRPVLYFNILLWSTLLLPPKPVLWGAFCKSSVFRTWREYFSFSYLFEEVLDSKKKYIFAE